MQHTSRRHIPAALIPGGTNRETRLTGFALNPEKDSRSEARRDRDRIYYSSAWRRLGGVTQVLSPLGEGGVVLHTRLTHSEKVAQVSRHLAESLLGQAERHETILTLGGLDVDAAEAAALAHDLGHPPFGHIGEEVLDARARARPADGGLGLSDGFEGNAQTFRIITKLERRHTRYDGLDLSRASLSAVAKYPWCREPTLAFPLHEQALRKRADYRLRWRKFTAYESERAELEAAREYLPYEDRGTQSLEASVMDVADDITYAVHDLEDFYLAGVLKVRAVTDALAGTGRSSAFDSLARHLKRDYGGYYDKDLFRAARDAVLSDLKKSVRRDYTGSPDDQAEARRHLHNVLARLVNSVVLRPEAAWAGGPHFALPPAEWHEVQILKEITRTFIVQRSDVALLQRGQQRMLQELIGLLTEWKDSPHDFERLPPPLRAEIEIARRQERDPRRIGYRRPRRPRRGEENRCILDYICTFTDDGCIALYRTLTGARWPRIGSGL